MVSSYSQRGKARKLCFTWQCKDRDFLREPEPGGLCVKDVLILNSVIYMLFVRCVWLWKGFIVSHPWEGSMGGFHGKILLVIHETIKVDLGPLLSMGCAVFPPLIY